MRLHNKSDAVHKLAFSTLFVVVEKIFFFSFFFALFPFRMDLLAYFIANNILI